MAGQRQVITDQQIQARSSAPFRIAGGITIRPAGANPNSEWILNNNGDQMRITREEAYFNIREASRAGLLADFGRAPTEDQQRRVQPPPVPTGSQQQSQTSNQSSGASTAGASAAQEQTAAERSNNFAKNAASRTSEISKDLVRDTNTSNTAFNVKTIGRDIFNINRFRSEISSYDNVLPTHSFLVAFSPMPWVKSAGLGSELYSNLTMRCDSVMLPSINLLQEQAIRRYGYGPVENVAYGVNLGDFTLQFIVDKQSLILDFFEAWLNRIVNRDSYGGANMNPNTGPRPYEVAYKDTYSCPSVNVFVYDRAQNTTFEYNIYDVYPIGIQSMNLSWSEENSLMRISITLAFTDLRIKPKVSAFEQGSDRNASDLANIKLGSAGQRVLEENEKYVARREELAQTVASAGGLTNPVVIGDSKNSVPRTFGAPKDVPAQPTAQPAVYRTETKNAFGQKTTIA